MNSINIRLTQVQEQIAQACRTYNRDPESVQLLAVSKTRPVAEITQALEAGQLQFGENYLQDAVEKIQKINHPKIEWHYIGRIQSKKTRPIAEHFAWAHCVEQLKHAQRLNDQRPAHLPPLNVCLQIKIDDEQSKGGLSEQEACELIISACKLPRIRIRGLMTLPAPTNTLEQQRKPFRQLRALQQKLSSNDHPLDTLSMGMSGDLEAAIAEGANIVRIGTAIFGPRS